MRSCYFHRLFSFFLNVMLDGVTPSVRSDQWDREKDKWDVASDSFSLLLIWSLRANGGNTQWRCQQRFFSFCLSSTRTGTQRSEKQWTGTYNCVQYSLIQSTSVLSSSFLCRLLFLCARFVRAMNSSHRIYEQRKKILRINLTALRTEMW